MTLPKEYEDGVYLDPYQQRFCTLVDTGDDIVVQPVEPGQSNPLYSFSQKGISIPEGVEKCLEDFILVPDRAVEHPAKYLKERLDELQAGDFYRSELSMMEHSGIQYARRHTEIESIENGKE
jgi:hypothetical protein